MSDGACAATAETARPKITTELATNEKRRRFTAIPPILPVKKSRTHHTMRGIACSCRNSGSCAASGLPVMQGASAVDSGPSSFCEVPATYLGGRVRLKSLSLIHIYVVHFAPRGSLVNQQPDAMRIPVIEPVIFQAISIRRVGDLLQKFLHVALRGWIRNAVLVNPIRHSPSSALVGKLVGLSLIHIYR